MKGEKVFTVIAGINGAGKTSLYHVLRRMTDLGKRINIDELSEKYGGSFDPRAQIRAGREAMAAIAENIEKGISFHLETTLPGAAILRQVKAAKEHGFTVRLCFIGVEDVRIAMERVHKRMENGGHGISDAYILKRFSHLNDSLRQLLPLCDSAILFDNTVRFRQIAVLEGQKLIDCESDLPCWFIDLVDGQEEMRQGLPTEEG